MYVRVTTDLLVSSDHGCISRLVLLDLGAVFDTVDQDILLERLECHVGICGLALAWFRFYLPDCYHFVYTNEEMSDQTQVKYGVPQGSVLGPLFSLYFLSPLGHF